MKDKHRPDSVAGSSRKSGSHTDGSWAGHRPSPRDEVGIKDIQPGFGKGDRGPSGSHLENTQPNKQVPPVATRKGQKPDLSFPR